MTLKQDTHMKSGCVTNLWLRCKAVEGGGLRANVCGIDSASSLADVCSTNAGEGGGSSANVCCIDSARSLADVCNTNDNEAFKSAAREISSANKTKGIGRGQDSQGQRGRCAIGRPASAIPRTRFAGSTPNSDEEAFETPDSIQSSAQEVVCKSILFEKSPENWKHRVGIVNDIHEQNLQTDLTL